MGPLFCRNL